MMVISDDLMQYENDFMEYIENYEEDEPPVSYLSWAQIISVVLHSVAFLLGVPGNAIVIWIMGFKLDKTVTSLWFLNLAIADLIFVFFLPLYITYVVLGFHWPFGKWLCKANSFIALLNMFASVFFLTAISLDRYIHLIHPAFSYKHRTIRNTHLLILTTWFLAMLLGSPALYFRDTLMLPDNVTICYNNFDVSNIDLIVLRHHVLTWVRFICGYLFPFITMIICYSLLIIQVKRSAILTSNRLFQTVLAVVVAFFVCWTPYHMFSILELSAHHNRALHDLLPDAIPLAVGFGFMNSCLNPILYVLLSKKLQSCFRGTLSELVKRTFREVSRSGTVSEHVLNSMSLQEWEAPEGEIPPSEILE